MRLAAILGEDPNVLLALAGKLSTGLQQIIIQRPKLFGGLLRQPREAPDHAILRLAAISRAGRPCPCSGTVSRTGRQIGS